MLISPTLCILEQKLGDEFTGRQRVSVFDLMKVPKLFEERRKVTGTESVLGAATKNSKACTLGLVAQLKEVLPQRCDDMGLAFRTRSFL